MARRLPWLLAISDGSLTEPAQGWGKLAELDAWLSALSESAVDTVQLREKALSDRALFRLAQHVRQRLPSRVRILVNGRLDLALAAGCQGVHLPTNGVPPSALRQRFGPQVLIGCSTHHPEEVAQAASDGADYATFGPVYDTPSKAAYGPPPGLAGLRQARSHGLPVLALGGVGPSCLGEVAAAGAAGVAGISSFRRPQDLAQLHRAAVVAWRQGPETERGT